MILLVWLLVVLVCTAIGALVALPGVGLFVGMFLACVVVWASFPRRCR